MQIVGNNSQLPGVDALVVSLSADDFGGTVVGVAVDGESGLIPQHSHALLQPVETHVAIVVDSDVLQGEVAVHHVLLVQLVQDDDQLGEVEQAVLGKQGRP